MNRKIKSSPIILGEVHPSAYVILLAIIIIKFHTPDLQDYNIKIRKIYLRI